MRKLIFPLILVTALLGYKVWADFTTEAAQVDLIKIQNELLLSTGWKHASQNGGKGFAGLSLDEENGKLRVDIIWTDDGKNGYEKKDFSTLEKTKIKTVTDKYIK